jgi:hypothetical protein
VPAPIPLRDKKDREISNQQIQLSKREKKGIIGGGGREANKATNREAPVTRATLPLNAPPPDDEDDATLVSLDDDEAEVVLGTGTDMIGW